MELGHHIEICVLLHTGHSPKEIAKIGGVSEQTVYNQKKVVREGRGTHGKEHSMAQTGFLMSHHQESCLCN